MQKINIESLKEGINEFRGKENKNSLLGGSTSGSGTCGTIDELAQVHLIGDAEINLQLIKNRDKVRVKGQVKFSLNLICSLCLTEFISHKVGDIDTLFIPYSNDEITDPDIFFYEHKMIDVQEVIHDTILLAIPIRTVCTPECKGLCPKCGKNLNEGTCRCLKT